MEAGKNIESFLSLNVQLDCFDDTNFTRWKGEKEIMSWIDSMIFTIGCYLQKEIGIDLNINT